MDDTLLAETRKGSTLKLKKSLRDNALDIFNIRRDNLPYNNWTNLLSNKIAGLFQSRLYLGNWNLEGFMQDFTLKVGNHSLLSKNTKWIKNNYIDTFNASTFASEHLFMILDGYRRKKRKQIIRSVLTFTPQTFRLKKIYH